MGWVHGVKVSFNSKLELVFEQRKLGLEQRTEAVITNCHAGDPNQGVLAQQTQQKFIGATR
jgi:hypothetical protein